MNTEYIYFYSGSNRTSKRCGTYRTATPIVDDDGVELLDEWLSRKYGYYLSIDSLNLLHEVISGQPPEPKPFSY